MRIWITSVICLAASAAEPCLVVEGDRFSAGELAKVAPLFAQADPAAPAGYTPAPGIQRLLRRPEMENMARQMGIAGEVPSSVCIQRFAEALTREQIAAALEAALEGTGARLDILDFSKLPAPRGKIEFPRSGLIMSRGEAQLAPVVWKGRLLYSGARSVSVWAKVRVSVTRQRVIAASDLPSGKRLAAENVRLEKVEEYPFGADCAREVNQVMGLVPRRSIRAGEALRLNMLSTQKEVARGDKVEVTVDSGGARLNFTARAETSAGVGDRVLVKNPENGKRFAARVESKGKVAVVAEGSSGVR